MHRVVAPIFQFIENVIIQLFKRLCKDLFSVKRDDEEKIAIFNEIKEKKGILNEDIEIEEKVERRSLS